MTESEQAESYWHWLRVAARCAFPMRQDWANTAWSLRDFLSDLGSSVAITLLRLFVLLTLPIFVPVASYWMYKRRHHVVKERARMKQELIYAIKGRRA